MNQNKGTAIRYRYPGSEVTNLLFNFLDDSNEEIMGREQKEEVLWLNVAKHC